MARQQLGARKLRRLKKIVGRTPIAAFVDNSWPHHWVEVWLSEKDADWVHIKKELRFQKVRSGTIIVGIVHETKIDKTEATA